MTERSRHIDLSGRVASSVPLSLCPERSVAFKLGLTLKSPKGFFKTLMTEPHPKQPNQAFVEWGSASGGSPVQQPRLRTGALQGDQASISLLHC